MLRGWYDREGSQVDFAGYRSEDGTEDAGGRNCCSAMNWKNFMQVKNENIGQSDKADYFTREGTVRFIRKKNCLYTACLTENCSKKMVKQGSWMYRCEKCNIELPNFKYRLILLQEVTHLTSAGSIK